MRGLIAFLFLLKTSFALEVILTDYWNGEDPAKAKEACMNDPTSFTFTRTLPSRFTTGVDDNEVCNEDGTDCQWTGTDYCYYWGLWDTGIIYQNFTYMIQDAKDVTAWATRPFCGNAAQNTKRLKSGDCFIQDIETMEEYTKVSVPPKSKECVLIEEVYKHQSCTSPANAFSSQYEFNMDECFVYGYESDVPDGIWVMKVENKYVDTYQISQYKDPNCLFEDNDPDYLPQVLKIGDCLPNFDRGIDDTPFKTYTKVVSLKCDGDDDKTNQKSKEYHQNSEHTKSYNYTSFTGLMKKRVRNSKLKMVNP